MDQAMSLQKIKKKTSWFSLPQELRVKICELMTSETRYHYGMCSKLCAEDVVQCHNYCHTLKFDQKPDIVMIMVNFHEDNGITEEMFVRNSISCTDIKTEKYCHTEWNFYIFNVKYEEKLRNVDYKIEGGKHFEKIIKKCQKSLKKLTWMTNDVIFDENCIRKFPRLETLIIDTENEQNVRFLLGKCPGIRELDLDLKMEREEFMDEIVQLIETCQPHKLTFRSKIPMSNAQFQRIAKSCAIFECAIGNVNTRGYIGFVEMWKNGQLPERFQKMRLHYDDNVDRIVLDDVLDALDVEMIDEIWDEDGRKLLFEMTSKNHPKKFGHFTAIIHDARKDVYLDFKIFYDEEDAYLNILKTLKWMEKHGNLIGKEFQGGFEKLREQVEKMDEF